MIAKGFIDLVTQMRHAQRMYYETRDRGWLGRAKTLENRVDELLASCGPGLFDGDDDDDEDEGANAR